MVMSKWLLLEQGSSIWWCLANWFFIGITYATVLGFDTSGVVIFASYTSSWLLTSTSILIETFKRLLLLL